jgi:hypothetical protein
MHGSRGPVALSVLLIAVGTGWLLSSLGYAPQIAWLWVLALAGIGVTVFAMSGFDKVSVAVGPFFLAASGLSALRQAGAIAFHVEVPMLVILSGVLLLIASRPWVPAPTWFVPEKPPR